MARWAMMQSRRLREASPDVPCKQVTSQQGSCVAGVKGMRKFGLTSVFERSNTASKGVVPFSHAQLRRARIKDKALRRPFTFRPYFRARPAHRTSGPTRFNSRGKSCLHTSCWPCFFCAPFFRRCLVLSRQYGCGTLVLPLDPIHVLKRAEAD